MVEVLVTIGGRQLPLDLQDNTDVTLEWRSALEGGFDEVLASSSYTMTVPRSRRNRRIFGDAFQPSEGRRGAYLAAEVRKDGLTIIPSASLILTGQKASTYEVALVWNNGSAAYRAWVEGDYSLQDGWDYEYIDWTPAVADYYTGRVALMFFATYDAGNFYSNRLVAYSKTGSTVERAAAIMPSSNVYALLSGVAGRRGLSFGIPTGIQWIFRNHAILLTTRELNDFVRANAIHKNVLSVTLETETTMTEGNTVGTNVPSDVRSTYSVTFSNGKAGYRYCYTTDGKDMRLVLDFSIGGGYDPETFDPETGIYFLVNGLELVTTLLTFSTSEVNIMKIYPTSVEYGMSDIGTPIYTAYFQGEWKISASSYDAVVLHYTGPDSFSYRWDMPTSDFSQYVPQCFIVQEESAGVMPGGKYPLAPNLPDLTEVEFVKAMAAFAGCFLDFSGGSLEMIPYDDLFGGKRKGTEYRGRVIVDADREPGERGFAFGDFSRLNRFAYKEDDSNGGYNADGYLTVDDESLDPLDDGYYEFPFAATRGDEAAQWKITYDEKSGSTAWSRLATDAEFTSIDHRFMKILSMNSRAALMFTKDMTWERILAERYAEYQRVMRKPVVLTASLLLDGKELRELDLTRSHYIAELGHDYIIISAQWSSSDGLTQMELLQID